MDRAADACDPGPARAGRPHRQARPDGHAVAQPETLYAAAKRCIRPIIGVRHNGREIKARREHLADMRQGDAPLLAKAHPLGNPRGGPPYGIREPVCRHVQLEAEGPGELAVEQHGGHRDLSSWRFSQAPRNTAVSPRPSVCPAWGSSCRRGPECHAGPAPPRAAGSTPPTSPTASLSGGRVAPRLDRSLFVPWCASNPTVD